MFKEFIILSFLFSFSINQCAEQKSIAEANIPSGANTVTEDFNKKSLETQYNLLIKKLIEIYSIQDISNEKQIYIKLINLFEDYKKFNFNEDFFIIPANIMILIKGLCNKTEDINLKNEMQEKMFEIEEYFPADYNLEFLHFYFLQLLNKIG